MKKTYKLSQDELKQAIAKYLNIKKDDISWCGNTGMFNFGIFFS